MWRKSTIFQTGIVWDGKFWHSKMVSGEDTEGPHATLLVESIEKCKPHPGFLVTRNLWGRFPIMDSPRLEPFPCWKVFNNINICPGIYIQSLQRTPDYRTWNHEIIQISARYFRPKFESGHHICITTAYDNPYMESQYRVVWTHRSCSCRKTGPRRVFAGLFPATSSKFIWVS